MFVKEGCYRPWLKRISILSYDYVDIYNEERKKGRKEGRKEARKEGSKEARKVSRKQGR